MITQHLNIEAQDPEDLQTLTVLQSLIDNRRQDVPGWKHAFFIHTAVFDAYSPEETDEDLAAVEEQLFLGIIKKLNLEIKLVHQKQQDDASSLVIIADNENAISLISSGAHYLTIKTWSTSLEQAASLNKKFGEFLPTQESEPNTVPFNFWNLTSNGQPYATEKDLLCPRFEEIKDNYNSDIVKQFEKLVNLENPDEFGKIIIWNGPPGNGKTYLIRALSREWNIKHKVEPEIVIDPEAFFQQSHYLDKLLTHGVSAQDWEEGDSEAKFRLVIIEDFAHIISTDCRKHPGFSRLLNATDGLLGQGQRIIFLLTTNEELTVIDPAVLRAGRCLQRLEIKSMSREASKEWLKKKGADPNALIGKDDVSLADLYAIVHGNPFDNETEEEKFGFVS